MGRDLLAALLLGQPPGASEPVRLRELWRRYAAQCPAFLDNAPQTRADTETRVRCLLGYFGPERDVATFTADDVTAYRNARLAGGFAMSARPGDTEAVIVRPAGNRSAQADLKLLVSMLRWATTVAIADGRRRWLGTNPLAGVRLPRPLSPRRPVATFERFERTRAAIAQLEEQARSEEERHRWRTLGCVLAVAEAVGRRLSSVRALAWRDVDFGARLLTWRGATDKARVTGTVPMPAPAADALREYQRQTGRIAGYVFTRLEDPEVPVTRHWLSWWLRAAECAAGLPKLEGGLWHPYRRKFASERMHHPLKALAEAGGWHDTRTITECYQVPSAAMIRDVMDEPRKLREVAGGT